VRQRRKDRLPGKFTFTAGVKTIDTTEDMREYLEVGDIISRSRVAAESNYRVASLTSAVVTVETNVSVPDAGEDVNAYSDVSIITLPYCASTQWTFTPVRRDGGAIVKALRDGTIRQRAQGFRVRVVFNWGMLDQGNFKRLVKVFNHQTAGGIEVQPHEDVRIRWRMIPDGDFNPEWTAGKLLGANVTMGFTGADVIPNIPEASSGVKGGPGTF
jgi:hypothetical protein